MFNELNVRQLTEEREKDLSPWAVQSRLSRGRPRPEEPCQMRTAFQRDRDRILYSKAFRRLKHKTQVFITPLDDHFVTRLTHTLEVAQIARTVARALNLNEDLTEAIALGHDLGHTPFGHIGEQVLNELYPPGFRHNEQSLRVVDVLEKDGAGLNLTWEVRDGILNHSKARTAILGEEWGRVSTLEGEVCKVADIIAYINHDIEDAIRAGVIAGEDLPAPAITVLGHSVSERINTMVADIVRNSWAVRRPGCWRPGITMSPEIVEAMNTLRDFLFDRVYNASSTEKTVEGARETVRRLYRYFSEHPDRLPLEFRHDSQDALRGVLDYIAGMTDQFALRLAEEVH
ncbi:MAG: deoxyguanosinetriphosphate triphosphohydrolase [Chloroflexi bacterium]|nr:deoxyguanosinetriphosphate triphosphohydrolase [Chloroflexota bacterium]